MNGFFNRGWYARSVPFWLVLPLLLPISAVFGVISAWRRWAYRQGFLRSERLPVPVIVVGNITVGGSGKTPLVIALVEVLRAAGKTPGVISRGYGGQVRVPTPVTFESRPEDVGDEPVLIARRTACPLWVGRRRAEVGRQLLANHPEVDVLISDDGLQHYALQRDVEIVVLDGARGLGNGFLLPAGPLRETRRRLDDVDAVVVNGAGLSPLTTGRSFTMQLEGDRFWNLKTPENMQQARAFSGGAVHALAGIGNPSRFFVALRKLGLEHVAHAFPDHYRYSAEDLPAGTVLMTEKDAVKCADFMRDDLWALKIDAQLEPGFINLILDTCVSDNRQKA